LPLFCFMGDEAAHPLRDQLGLRVAVAVERHLVRLSRFRNGFDANTPDSVSVEQIARRHQDALSHRYGGPNLFAEFFLVSGNICLHDMFYPGLTKMLPTGNIGQLS